MPGYNIEKYNSTLALCKASLNKSFVIGYEGQFNQEITYYIKNENNPKYTFLGNSIDLPTKIKAAQFHAVDKSGELSSAAASTLGDLSNVRDFDRAYTYFKYVLSNPLHCPLFAIEQSYLFFDHQSDSLYSFSDNGKKKGSVFINHHKMKGWYNKLYVDYSTQEVYALFKLRNRLQLRKVNLNDGSLETTTLIDGHSFPEKIMLRDGILYYLYRSPYQSGAPQNLFKKRIN